MTCIAPGCRAPQVAPQIPFCPTHLRSPPGTRGGWLSAHRRALQRANVMPNPHPQHLAQTNKSAYLDANRVARRLWMGSKPPADRALPAFGVVVLCAAEYQPIMACPGMVLRCPLADADPTPSELAMATAAARQVAQLWRGGHRILVTCHAGWNRSGLVTGLALLQLTRKPAGVVIASIRAARGPNALSNDAFVAVLERLARSGRPGPAPRR